MSTFKNGQISLYCNLNKIVKRPGTSFQSPLLSQKHVRKCFSYNTLVFDQISLGFKRNKHECNFHYRVMSMVTSQILKTVDFTNIQKFRYLENKTLIFSKKSVKVL